MFIKESILQQKLNLVFSKKKSSFQIKKNSNYRPSVFWKNHRHYIPTCFRQFTEIRSDKLKGQKKKKKHIKQKSSSRMKSLFHVEAPQGFTVGDRKKDPCR